MPSLRQLPKKSSLELSLYRNQFTRFVAQLKMVHQYCYEVLPFSYLAPLVFIMNLSSCVPYSIIQRQVFEDQEKKVAISCEWINKGLQFKRLVFCESEHQYMVLFHHEPWLTYEKQHFQRYLSYLLKEFFKRNQLDLSKFQFSKINVWIHSQTFAPEKVTFFIQIKDLLIHLPLYPKKWHIGRQNTFYFLGGSVRFPYSSYQKLSLVDVELREDTKLANFSDFIRKEFPKTSIIKATLPLIRVKVPVFLEVSYSSRMFHHPLGKEIIKDIRPVPGPGVKLGDLKRVSRFDLYLSSKEQEQVQKKVKAANSSKKIPNPKTR